jgi:hypothetical protein
MGQPLTDDFLFIDLGDPQWQLYDFNGSYSIDGACNGEELWLYNNNWAEPLDLPVAKSYDTDPSKGETLTAQVVVDNSLIMKLIGDGMKITDYNAEYRDIFNQDGKLREIVNALNAKFQEKFDDTIEKTFAEDIATNILLEMKRIRAKYASGTDSVFTKAAKIAMLKSRSPTSNYDDIFQLRTFCKEATIALLGLGHANGSFKYNFGASLLFSPYKVITTKSGNSRITGKAKYYYGTDGDREICSKCIIIYKSGSERQQQENFSFGFRADDTFSDSKFIEDAVQAKFRTFSDNPANFETTMRNWLTQAVARVGGWKSPIVKFDGNGIAVRAKIGSPRKDDPQKAGVFNVAFAFNFGEDNGSLWIGNMALTFVLNIDNYLSEVGRIQQMRARYKEAVENYQRKLKQLAKELADQYKRDNPDVEKTDVNLLLKNEQGENNYASRDQNAQNGLLDKGNIFDNLNTPVPEGTGGTTNNGNNTYENTTSDFLKNW